MSLTFFYSVSTKKQYVLIVKIIDQPEAPCRLPCWNLQVVKAGGGGDVTESVPHQLVPGKHRAGQLEFQLLLISAQFSGDYSAKGITWICRVLGLVT